MKIKGSEIVVGTEIVLGHDWPSAYTVRDITVHNYNGGSYDVMVVRDIYSGIDDKEVLISDKDYELFTPDSYITKPW